MACLSFQESWKQNQGLLFCVWCSTQCLQLQPLLLTSYPTPLWLSFGGYWSDGWFSLQQGSLSEKIAVKMDCVPGVLLSLLEASETQWRVQAGRSHCWPLSVRNEEGKTALEQLPLLIALKWTRYFSLGDPRLKTIHLVYKWNRGRWTSPFLR